MRILTTLAVLIVSLPSLAEWQPDPDDELQVAAAATIQEMKAAYGEETARFFAESAGIVVFPTVKRGGILFGWASGRGIVLEGDELAKLRRIEAERTSPCSNQSA